MSQLYIQRSKAIVNEEFNTDSVFTSPGDWESRMDFLMRRHPHSEFKIACVFPQAGFLKRILLPINPSLGGRSFAQFKVNTDDYNNPLKNLFYIHFVFDQGCEWHVAHCYLSRQP
ncbi:starch-binding associating with outer membrane family protein [Babesia caballi]|uniref:Starch-binding associating with outer membrane family protein n=1 Tax=Babesia caballi TaxID=5871 RepID=A0AAV4LMQ7_BABCB|nr:starch-binding associating with outer membrane family protein [Babesia caballi]